MADLGPHFLNMLYSLCSGMAGPVFFPVRSWRFTWCRRPTAWQLWPWMSSGTHYIL